MPTRKKDAVLVKVLLHLVLLVVQNQRLPPTEEEVQALIIKEKVVDEPVP